MFKEEVKIEEILHWGGPAWLNGYLLPDPAAQGLIPSIPPEKLEEKLSMLLRLINGTAYRKIDSGLKMLIKRI